MRPTKVLVVIEENHTAAAALQGMPFLASLAAASGQATNYRAVAHPSLPNYLAIAGGSTFGVTDDQPPDRHHLTGQSVLDATLEAGATAKTYAEAMPEPCALTSSGTYAVKHNPWAYLSDAAPRANCEHFDLPAGTPTSGALNDDINSGTLPTVGLLVPDLCNDGHDCPLTTADGWLKQWIPAVMNGPDYQAGRLAIVVTFDEDDRSGPNTVLTTVTAPTIEKMTATTELTHYSLTRYLAELAGIAPANQAAAAPSVPGGVRPLTAAGGSLDSGTGQHNQHNGEHLAVPSPAPSFQLIAAMPASGGLKPRSQRPPGQVARRPFRRTNALRAAGAALIGGAADKQP